MAASEAPEGTIDPAQKVRSSGSVRDFDLLDRARRGDAGALERLYRHHAQAVFAFLVRSLDDDQLAEEAVQDTFVAVWKGAKFDGRSQVRTWLIGIARRQAAARRRRKRLPMVRSTGDPVSPRPTPEEAMLASDEAASLAKDLSYLTRAQREVVLLAFGEQLTYVEIAKVLGISVGTVKSRMHSAKGALTRRWRAKEDA